LELDASPALSLSLPLSSPFTKPQTLNQVEKFAAKCPGKEMGLRFNPGVGSGGTGKTNVGGPSSSFGIWHEHAAQVRGGKYNSSRERLGSWE